MRFVKDGVDITLDSPAQYPLIRKRKWSQAKEYSASGVMHVENFSLQTNKETYAFVDMTDADYQLLIDFFIDTTVASLHTFTLTNDLDETKESRFLDDELAFKKNDYGLWNGFFRVEYVQ